MPWGKYPKESSVLGRLFRGTTFPIANARIPRFKAFLVDGGRVINFMAITRITRPTLMLLQSCRPSLVYDSAVL